MHAPLLQDERLPQDHGVRSVRLNPVHDPWQGCVAPVVRPPACLPEKRLSHSVMHIMPCHDHHVRSGRVRPRQGLGGRCTQSNQERL